ncbi:MAG: type II secretion system protein M [Burkholderiaceae bacterium]|jgi:general secretion pathway protein M|nr:type II secretion system protein M [Burkholderiaceae bacterium]
MSAWTRLVVRIALSVLLAAVLLAAWAYHAAWVRYGDALDQLQARSMRLDGLAAAGGEIDAALKTVSTDTARWLHPASANAQNEVQQRLREIIVASGATLVSAQGVLEPAAEGQQQLALIRLTATVGGSWENVVHFLEALQTQTPVFWVRNAGFLRDGASKGGKAQSVRITLQLEAPLAPEKAAP